MINKQKGFATPLVVSIVALLVLGGGIYFYLKDGVKVKTVVPTTGNSEVVDNLPAATTSDRSSFQNQDDQNAARERARLNSEGAIACTMDAKQCSDGTYVGRSGPNCEFVCPEITVDVPPPLGSSTLMISCSSMGDCNTEGVNSTRSDFFVIIDGNKVKVLIDIETRLRFVMGPNETLKKWAEFYPLIQSSSGWRGMPFSATIYGNWIDANTFKANWIKWTIG